MLNPTPPGVEIVKAIYNAIKPRNKVKIKKQKVLDAYFATEETKKEYETKTIVHIVGTTSKASSLSSIANAYKGVKWEDIQKENKMGKSTIIHAKQKLNITTKVEKGKKLSFKKLSKANLGDEVYIIVKTLNLEGKQIRLNVRQGKVKGIEKENEPIKLHQKGNDVHIAEEKVGNYSTKKDITNAADFKEWAIFKVILGSKEDKILKAYKESIEKLKDKKTSLFLVIDAHSKSGLKVTYNGYNPDKDGKPDDRTTPNYWLDMKGKWFEVKYESCKDTWDKASNTRIKKLHSHIQCATKNFINNVEKDLKIKLRVVSGYRSFSEQTTLYNQGRTTGGSIVTNAKAGSSNHNYGIAIDVCEIKGKVANWDVSMYKKIAPYAKKEGFEWGGDWKSFIDNPHFEMTNGKSTSDLLKLYNSNNKDYTKIKI